MEYFTINNIGSIAVIAILMFFKGRDIQWFKKDKVEPINESL